jgi:halimadienyl-diphosphate synthase
MCLEDRARKLACNLQGRLGASAYDVAWLARLSDGASVRWPQLTDWLLDNQWLDGSWGGTIRYYHDRILSTLAAVIALKEHSDGKKEVKEAIRQGVRYIWNNLQFLHHDPIELVGFELILPTLMAQARLLHLDVPRHSGGYARIRGEKLRLLPLEMMYAPGTSVAFSLEFLGENGLSHSMQHLQGKNGAIANSPATTAYFLQQQGNHKAIDYLEKVLALSGGVPAFYPFRTFETAWVLEHLSFGGFALDRLVEPSVWKSLKLALGNQGTGIDPLFGINDGDTTAVTLHVLALGGHTVDPMILHHFEESTSRSFQTFAFERNASVATNAHALEALSLMSDYPNRREIWDRVVATLLESQKYRSYWIDKWHASPYYATAHTLITLIKAKESMLAECLDSVYWILHTQREDGSWGYFDRGTAEETAYALLALLHYHEAIKPVDLDVLKRGRAFLFDLHRSGNTYPELWIAKSLYTPYSIVEAAILAAMNLYQETLGS